MARYLRIRCIVKTDLPSAYERVDAICGVKPDGSHWTLTQANAVSEIEDGISMFYIERAAGKRFDVIVTMDFRSNKYLKTVADRDQPDELLYLPACPHFAHTPHSPQARAASA
jgi:hypothetical protein